MARNLSMENKKLNKHLHHLGDLVQKQVEDAISSFFSRDSKTARQLIDQDNEIDRYEVEVEEECLKVLALHQPVAKDLRYIIATLKITNDLERIGDLATSIAENTIAIADFKNKKNSSMDLPFMMKKVLKMTQDSIDAFFNVDATLAENVIKADFVIDEMHQKNKQITVEDIKAGTEQIAFHLHYLSISRHLERIADHATNIAEDVYYLIEGEIIRHTFIKDL